ASRVVHVAAGTTVQMSDLTMREGFSPDGGGCLYNEGTLALNRIAIEECVSTGGGGGLRNDGVLTSTRSTIWENVAVDRYGGGMDNVFGASLTLTVVTVSGNIAAVGGGIDNFGV